MSGDRHPRRGLTGYCALLNGETLRQALDARTRRREQLFAQGWTGCTACGSHGTIHWTPPAYAPLVLNGPEWSDSCAQCGGKGLVPPEHRP